MPGQPRNILNTYLASQIYGAKINNNKNYKVIAIKHGSGSGRRTPRRNVEDNTDSNAEAPTTTYKPIQTTLPSAIIERMNRSSNGVMRIIMELEDYVTSVNLLDKVPAKAVLNTLKSLSRILYDSTAAANPNIGQNGLPPVLNKTNHVAGHFVSFGGIGLLEEILLRLPVLWQEKYPGEKGGKTRKDGVVAYSAAVQRVLNECGGLLRELIFIFNHLGSVTKLGSNHFILHVFQYLLRNDTFDMAVGLLEEIFSVRKEMFCILDVPNIYKQIMSFSQRQLCVFCRLFALLIFADIPSAKDVDPSEHTNGPISRKDADEYAEDHQPDVHRLESVQSPTSATTRPASNTSPMSNGNGSPLPAPSPENSSSPQPKSMSGKKRKASSKNKRSIPLLKDKGMLKRRIIRNIDRNQAFLAGHTRILDRLLLLIYKSIRSLPASRHYSVELSAFNNLQPSPEMLEIMWLKDDKSEEEEWYDDLNDFETNFYQNTDNPYKVTDKSSQRKATVDLRSIFEVLRRVISNSGIHDHHPPVNRRSNANADIDMSKLTMRDLTITMHLVEILFVLAIVCHGRRKRDLQQYFQSKQLGRMLNLLFNALDWTPEPRQTHGPHGPGCQCNTTSAVKVQFLRLTHNFCEREDDFMGNRLQLLSWKQQKIREEIRRKLVQTPPHYEALQEVFQYARHEVQTLNETKIDADEKSKLIFDEDIEEASEPFGLLSKIIKLLTFQNEESYSAYRFWLASCVEGYLRGSQPEDQILVAAHNNFMSHVVRDVIALVGNDCHGLQTNFDLLGEMVKFNSTVLNELDAILTEDQFQKFFDVIRMHLVDSNVFVRSLVLTLEFEVMSADACGLRKKRTGFPTGQEQYVYDKAEDTRFRLAKHHAAASSRPNEKTTAPPPLYVGRTKFHHYIEDYRRQMICDVCTAT